MKKLSAIGLVILFISTGCYAIQVSGDVWGEWHAEDNPYEVVGDLRVPPESTIMIGPRCFIDFQGHYKFIIDSSASLQALGTESDSIIFTASDTVTGWLGLRFSHADSSSLIYCIVEWGRTLDHNNPPYNNGAAIYCLNSNLQISHCKIRHNSACEGVGGGICCDYSRIDINYNVIINNHAAFGGCGIYCYGSMINILNNMINYNVTFYPTGGELYGGSIGCSNSEIIIEKNLISHNFCGMSGAGISIRRSNARVSENNIIHNYSWDSGAGMIIWDSSYALIKQNLIADNYVDVTDGGAIANWRSHLSLINNTILDNFARWRGGAIWTRQGIFDTLLNNIIWGNQSGDSLQIYVYQETLTVLYCDIQDTLWPGEGNISDYPRFCNPEEGDFHLAENSPCVGAGYNGADIGAFGIGCGPIGIYDKHIFIPSSITLYPNYPNPFNASTIITYTLPQPGLISLDIYDLLGRKVESLFDGLQPSGEHSLIWSAEGLSSGVYFYKLTAGEFSETKKMLLVR